MAQALSAEPIKFVVSRTDRQGVESNRTLTVLNRFPYNNGHLLVAPLAHKAKLTDLDETELLELIKVG